MTPLLPHPLLSIVVPFYNEGPNVEALFAKPTPMLEGPGLAWEVVDVINRMPERSRFMKGIFAWVGFRQTGIPYERGERVAGGTKWGFLKLLSFALDGLTSFSTFPLRVWSYVGGAIAVLVFFYIVIRLIRTLLYGVDIPGYESILNIMLFLGGMQLLTLGILGDYIGRVSNEVKGRPLWIGRSTHGIGKCNKDIER